jgi:hypothetical protein
VRSRDRVWLVRSGVSVGHGSFTRERETDDFARRRVGVDEAVVRVDLDALDHGESGAGVLKSVKENRLHQ